MSESDAGLDAEPPLVGAGPAPKQQWDVEASLSDRKAFLNQLSEGVIVADAAGTILFVNDAAELLHGQALLGVAPDDYSDRYHLFTMDGDPFPVDDLPLTRAVRNREVTTDVRWRIKRVDGSEVLAIGNARPIYDKYGKHVAAILNIRDDTRRHADELALKALVQTKDMLLHEVNHRVTNSLQLVTALLSLQAVRSEHAEVRSGLEDACNRISVIARIHQRLYASSAHDRINIGEMLSELAADNVAALSPDGQIRLNTDCQDLPLSLDQAVPLALCVTEIVTNALKYAFEGRDGGTIGLSARRVPGDRIAIRVTDDGKGLPVGFDAAQSTGLGMRIVSALVGQLRAEFAATSTAGGACFTIEFAPRAHADPAETVF